jgi:hypothetical protein
MGAVAGSTSPAWAAGNTPVVHPIYAQIKDAPSNDLALRRFDTAARRFGLGPVEIVDIEGDAVPATAEKIRAGIDLIRKLEFDPGRTALDDAAAEVAATGGAALAPAVLADLFLYRAWAIARVTFNPAHVPTPVARAQAYGELTRAVALAPERRLNPQQYPPLLLEDWARAVADVAARPQSTVVVHAAPEALVSCDGGTPVPGPATFVGLSEGEHLIRVDEPGWADWGGTITARGAQIDIAIPARRALTLDDATASAHARRMGARFALVAEPRPGRDAGLSLSLRLIDAAGARRDSAIEPLAGDAAGLDAAVMRLDETARRLDRGTAPAPTAVTALPAGDPTATTLPPPVLTHAPPPRPGLADDPLVWARDHWPLLTAVGVMIGAALVLSITVANDK